MEEFTLVKSVKALEKPFPKIGIRPVIDGRRKGIRESLEEQTINMAKSVSALIKKRIKHLDGTSPECVIADTCIGGVSESIRADEKFEKEGVGLTLSVTPSWCYSSETMDMHPTRPKAIWGLNGTERPGAVYLSAVLAAHSQKGLPAFGIYGKDVQDRDNVEIPKDVEQKILQFVKAGLAVAIMRGKSYLSIGGVSMGIAGSMVNPDFFEDYLAMRIEYIDMTELVRRVEEKIYDREEYQKAITWVKKYCKEGPDKNPQEIQKSRKEKNKDWEMVVKMTIIARDLMIGNEKLADLDFKEEALGHNAIIAGFQGQRHWTDHFPNGDFMETILNSSFDWNGIREPYAIATENDGLNAVSMLFGKLLTNTAQLFCDVRTYWSPDAVKRVTGHKLSGIYQNGFLHLINSGAASLDWTGEQYSIDMKPVIKSYRDLTSEDVKRCLNSTLFIPATLEYFRGGGFSTNFLTKGVMPTTMSRINLIKELGPVLQIAEGYVVNIPKEISDILDKRTDPTWPTTWFVPNIKGGDTFKDVYSVMNGWGANHAAVSYGHIGADLITLASMLRIPVCIHNVSDNKIFRPGMWNAFGTKDLEGADFRVCKSLGPLYR